MFFVSKIHSNTKRHIVIWTLLYLYFFLTNSAIGTYSGKIIYLMVSFLNIFVSYYLLAFYILCKSHQSSLYKTIILLLLHYLLFLGIDYWNVYKLSGLTGIKTMRAVNDPLNFLKNSGYFYLMLLFAGFATFLRRRRLEDLIQKLEREKHLVSANLGLLKDQFNSHLTLNFFSYCYSVVITQEPKEAHYVESFNEMLRYTLYTEAKNLVSISEEVSFISNLIEVQKCITKEVCVNFSVAGDTRKFKIIPMVLSLFVENSFKHGVINDTKNPITIVIKISENTLQFLIENSFAGAHVNQNKSGYGIENLRALLESFYKEKYKLRVTKTESKYRVTLNIGQQVGMNTG